MSRLIKVLTLTLVLVTVLLVSVTGMVFANGEPVDFDMVVSPNVYNIDSSSLYAHIHADIHYDGPLDATVTVNGTQIEGIGTFADLRGDLVVKFSIDKVKAIVYVGDEIVSDEAIFELTYKGELGRDIVPVIQPPKP